MTFTFLSPERLALLVVPLLLMGLYVLRQRRRRAYVVRFTDPALLEAVAPRRPGLRRHLVAASYLVAVLLLVVAAARPATATEVPLEPTVVLAFDTSLSMEARDVAPTRLAAAQEAAKRFLAAMPDGARVGLVTFDGSARAVIAPTTDRTAVERAVDRLALGPGTAIGEAIHASLDLLEVDGPNVSRPSDQGGGTGADPGAEGDAPGVGAVVLLSDGESTQGRPVEPAVRRAVQAGVQVSTIAFGTDHGTVTVDGFPVPVGIDRATLREIAEDTGGRAFEADSGAELSSVFEGLGEGLGTRTEPREITDQLALAALLAGVLAAAGSLAWFARLP
jgi:Ca-activated chloride channel family protein